MTKKINVPRGTLIFFVIPLEIFIAPLKAVFHVEHRFSVIRFAEKVPLGIFIAVFVIPLGIRIAVRLYSANIKVNME